MGCAFGATNSIHRERHQPVRNPSMKCRIDSRGVENIDPVRQIRFRQRLGDLT